MNVNSNNINSTKLKKHFPKIKKCICFLSEDKSFKFCTLNAMAYYIISLCLYIFVYGFKNVDNSIIYSEIIIAGIVLSHIILLIGVQKLKSFYMIQFILFYGIYIIIVILKEISIIMSTIAFNTNDNSKENFIYDIQNNPRLNIILSKYSEKNLNDFINSCYKYTIIAKIIEIIVMSYYYLVNCSYIEDMIEFVEHEDRFREYENNKNTN